MPLQINKPKASIPVRGIKAAKLNIAKSRGHLLDTNSILEHARAKLESLGLRTPTRPKDATGESLDPVFPTDLSLLTSEELGRYLGYYTAMVDYSGAQLALLDAAHLVEKYNDKVQGTISMLEADGKTKYEREAKAKLDTAVTKQALAYHVRVAEFKLTQTVHEGYVYKLKAISREIARRDSLMTAKLST